jgi:hypothetical protein
MLSLLHATTALLAFSVLFVLAHTLRARSTLGTPISVVRGGRRERWLGALALLAVAGIVGWAGPREVAVAALPALGLALVLQGLRPSFGDRVCTETGVRSGWFWRRHEQLEEWRLSGDHLRFRVRGDWLAVDLPRQHHAAMRERLARLIPDRESRFSDRQEPQLLATKSPLAMPLPAAAPAPKAEIADGGID